MRSARAGLFLGFLALVVGSVECNFRAQDALNILVASPGKDGIPEVAFTFPAHERFNSSITRVFSSRGYVRRTIIPRVDLSEGVSCEVPNVVDLCGRCVLPIDSCTSLAYEEKMPFFAAVHPIFVRQVSVLAPICDSASTFFIDAQGLAYITQQTAVTKVVAETSTEIVVDADSNEHHTFLLTVTGILYARGYGAVDGELGVGNVDELGAPVAIPVDEIRFIAIAAGRRHSIFVEKNGTVYATGSNSHGQLGFGSDVSRATTVRALDAFVDSGDRVLLCAAGALHTVVVTANGVAFAWGDNSYGQLALSHTQKTSRPQRVPLSDSYRIIGVTVGDYHTVFTTSTGEVFCVGRNVHGECGIGSVSAVVSPPQKMVLPQDALATIAFATYNRTIVILDNGTALYAGQNDYGEAGNGATGNLFTLTAVNITGEAVARAHCAHKHCLYATENGKLMASGYSDTNQLAVAGVNSTLEPLRMSSRRAFHVSVSTAAEFNTIIASRTGGVLGWGRNNRGQLGIGGPTGDKTTPIEIPIALAANETVVSMDVSSKSTYVLTSARLFVIGDNAVGELGLNATTSLFTAAVENTALPAGRNFSQVCCGESFAALLSTSGSVYVAGNVTDGVGGPLAMEEAEAGGIVRSFIQVTGALADNITIIDIACGTRHIVARSSDGEVFAWGHGGSGALGIGTRSAPSPFLDSATGSAVFNNFSSSDELPASQMYPVKIFDQTAYVVCGDEFCVARLVNGSVRAWGSNAFGQTGAGAAAGTTVHTPTTSTYLEAAGAGASSAKIRCGGAITIVVLANGTAVLFGDNTYGALGTNSANGTAVLREGDHPVALGSVERSGVAGNVHAVPAVPRAVVSTANVNGVYTGVSPASIANVPIRDAVAGTKHVVLFPASIDDALLTAGRPELGRTATQSCPYGRHNVFLDEEYRCVPCPPGTYGPFGDGECLACPAGTFSSVTGSSECSACPAGHVAPTLRHSSCIACPPDTYAKGDGISCVACPEGAVCEEEMLVSSTLMRKKRYWRPTTNSTEFFACSFKGACPAGYFGSACADGFDGVVCGTCSANYFRAGVRCLGCITNPLAAGAVVVVSFAIMMMLLRPVAVWIYAAGATGVAQCKATAHAGISLSLVFGMQVLVSILYMDVEMPLYVDEVLAFAQLVEFRVSGLIGIGCLLGSERFMLFFSSLEPLFWLGALVLMPRQALKFGRCLWRLAGPIARYCLYPCNSYVSGRIEELRAARSANHVLPHEEQSDEFIDEEEEKALRLRYVAILIYVPVAVRACLVWFRTQQIDGQEYLLMDTSFTAEETVWLRYGLSAIAAMLVLASFGVSVFAAYLSYEKMVEKVQKKKAERERLQKTPILPPGATEYAANRERRTDATNAGVTLGVDQILAQAAQPKPVSEPGVRRWPKFLRSFICADWLNFGEYLEMERLLARVALVALIPMLVVQGKVQPFLSFVIALVHMFIAFSVFYTWPAIFSAEEQGRVFSQLFEAIVSILNAFCLFVPFAASLDTISVSSLAFVFIFLGCLVALFAYALHNAIAAVCFREP